MSRRTASDIDSMNTPDLAGLFPPDPSNSVRVIGELQDSEFNAAWLKTRERFFKLECLQHYDERGVETYDAWLANDYDTVKALARQQASDQLGDPIEARIESVRVRLLKLPVTDYVRFENEIYQELSKVGDIILGIEATSLPASFVDNLQDFLLFDKHKVLVHDYDNEGGFLGSWSLSDPASIARYDNVANYLIDHAVLFDELASKYL